MTVFRLTGGTPEQRAIIRLALGDVSVVGNRGVLAARANGPKCRQIVIAPAPFAAPDDDAHGYLQITPRLLSIVLDPTLSDSQLYGVFLHELGHFLGLEHVPSGLMAPYYSQRSWGRLTPSLRRRLSGELGVLLLRKTLDLLVS